MKKFNLPKWKKKQKLGFRSYFTIFVVIIVCVSVLIASVFEELTSDWTYNNLKIPGFVIVVVLSLIIGSLLSWLIGKVALVPIKNIRDSMIRVANALCEKFRYKTIITGESLGQVASQTIESLTSTNAVAKYPVLRPLISFNKDEIIQIAKDIDTYETSVLPYEDCCTVFLPKNPIIKPKVKDAEREETKINLQDLLKAVIENIEVINLDD